MATYKDKRPVNALNTVPIGRQGYPPHPTHPQLRLQRRVGATDTECHPEKYST